MAGGREEKKTVEEIATAYVTATAGTINADLIEKIRKFDRSDPLTTKDFEELRAALISFEKSIIDELKEYTIDMKEDPEFKKRMETDPNLKERVRRNPHSTIVRGINLLNPNTILEGMIDKLKEGIVNKGSDIYKFLNYFVNTIKTNKVGTIFDIYLEKNPAKKPTKEDEEKDRKYEEERTSAHAFESSGGLALAEAKARAAEARARAAEARATETKAAPAVAAATTSPVPDKTKRTAPPAAGAGTTTSSSAIDEENPIIRKLKYQIRILKHEGITIAANEAIVKQENFHNILLLLRDLYSELVSKHLEKEINTRMLKLLPEDKSSQEFKHFFKIINFFIVNPQYLSNTVDPSIVYQQYSIPTIELKITAPDRAASETLLQAETPEAKAAQARHALAGGGEPKPKEVKKARQFAPEEKKSALELAELKLIELGKKLVLAEDKERKAQNQKTIAEENYNKANKKFLKAQSEDGSNKTITPKTPFEVKISEYQKLLYQASLSEANRSFLGSEISILESEIKLGLKNLEKMIEIESAPAANAHQAVEDLKVQVQGAKSIVDAERKRELELKEKKEEEKTAIERAPVSSPAATASTVTPPPRETPVVTSASATAPASHSVVAPAPVPSTVTPPILSETKRIELPQPPPTQTADGESKKQYESAKRLFHGKGIRQNRSKAIELFEALAAQNYEDAINDLKNLYGKGYYADNLHIAQSKAMAKGWEDYQKEEKKRKEETKSISSGEVKEHKSELKSAESIAQPQHFLSELLQLDILKNSPNLKILLLAYQDVLGDLLNKAEDSKKNLERFKGIERNIRNILNTIIPPNKPNQEKIQKCYKDLVYFTENDLPKLLPKKMFSEDENLTFIKSAVKASKNPPLASYISQILDFKKYAPNNKQFHLLLDGLILEVMRLYSKPDQELHSKDKAFRICQELIKYLKEKVKNENFRIFAYTHLCDEISEPKDLEPGKDSLRSALRYATSGFNQGRETNTKSYENIINLISRIEKDQIIMEKQRRGPRH